MSDCKRAESGLHVADDLDGTGSVRFRQQDRKFLATKACGHVARPTQHALQRGGDGAQASVAVHGRWVLPVLIRRSKLASMKAATLIFFRLPYNNVQRLSASAALMTIFFLEVACR